MTVEPVQALAFTRAVSPNLRAEGKLALADLLESVETILLVDPSTTPRQMATTERAGLTLRSDGSNAVSWIGHAMVAASATHETIKELRRFADLRGVEWDANGGNTHWMASATIVGRPVASATMGAAILAQLPVRAHRLMALLGTYGLAARPVAGRLRELGLA